MTVRTVAEPAHEPASASAAAAPASRALPTSARSADGRGGTDAPLWEPAELGLADSELAAGLVRGNEDCVAAAYHRWGGLIHALARRSLGDAREAEDVTQQVFIAAWRGRHGYRPDRGSLAGWLIGIAHRKIADALSARTRRSVLVATAGSALPPEPDAGAQPDAALHRVFVTRELAKLPAAQKQVLCMAFYWDLTHAEISERTGLPLGTVKSHSRRGLRRLRALLQADTALG
ncbi:RNA polymerase sigma factor [Streptomyces sp. CBMA29]|uniref:RNA polymerase sigma factor n=1 Tax=Streptomyces sp. CBMA29 TaxID=1896314 RepID=UPI001661BE50|nr:sigma-70 family RNA polymerase sigma factor [Streptomyces sp. CBMA29]